MSGNELDGGPIGDAVDYDMLHHFEEEAATVQHAPNVAHDWDQGGGGEEVGVEVNQNQNDFDTDDLVWDDYQINHICCVGAGRLGIFTTVVMADYHANTVFKIIDADFELIEKWRQGDAFFYEPEFLNKFNSVRNRNLFFEHQSELSTVIHQSDLIFIAVDIPLKEKGVGAKAQLEMSNIDSVMKSIIQNYNEKLCVIIRSTLPVGGCQKVGAMVSGYSSLAILYSPEFFSEGTTINDIQFPKRFVLCKVANVTNSLTSTLQTFCAPWASHGDFIVMTNISSAEVGKLGVNGFLAMKICYMNLLSEICQKIGADIDDVKMILNTDHHICEQFMNYNIGFGGPGLVKDVIHLKHICEKEVHHTSTKLFGKILELNKMRKKTFVENMLEKITSLKNKKIAIFGFANKKHCSDIRYSAAADICIALAKNEGVEIRIHDLHVSEAAIEGCFSRGAKVTAVATKAATNMGAHALCFLVNDHYYLDLPLNDLMTEMQDSPHVFVGCDFNIDFLAFKNAGFHVHIIGKPSF